MITTYSFVVFVEQFGGNKYVQDIVNSAFSVLGFFLFFFGFSVFGFFLFFFGFSVFGFFARRHDLLDQIIDNFVKRGLLFSSDNIVDFNGEFFEAFGFLLFFWFFYFFMFCWIQREITMLFLLARGVVIFYFLLLFL
jgi:hypothetical protein